MKLVSIIVPIYNAQKYLDECIESIVNQTYKNIEIILVNDGSTDNSIEICKEYSIKDSRIIVIDKINTGVSDSRNIGIKRSSGEYICFVDSDDFLDSKFVEVMVNAISQDYIDMAYCNYMYYYSGKFIQKKPRLTSKTYDIEELKSRIIDDGTMSGILFGSVWCGIYKKEIIEKYNIKFYEHIKHNEDGVFNIEYCLNANKINVLSDKSLYFYRQTESSSSRTYTKENKTQLASQLIFEICKNNICSKELQKQILCRTISENFWHILNLCSKRNNDSYYNIIKELKMILKDEDLKKCYYYINKEEINRYKNIYLTLMKKKKYRTIYILTRYIYPFLSSKLSR